MLLSLVFADLSITPSATTLTVNARVAANYSLACSQVPSDDEYTIFFESPIAQFDKCQVKVSDNGSQNVNLLGLLSDRQGGSLTEQLKTKICSKNKGDITSSVTLPTVNVVRDYQSAQKTCTSIGDPHITSFDGQTYKHWGIGDFWLLKNDDFDIQVKLAQCNPTATCNSEVGFRYLDNVWIATQSQPLFACNSKNKCASMHGVTIVSSPDKSTIITLPENVVIKTTLQSYGLDVSISAPGLDAAQYQTSTCNPKPGQQGTTSTTDYAVDPAATYFKADGCNIQLQSPIKPGYSECKLPVTCDGAYPAAQQAVTAYPASGVTLPQGFTPSPQLTYTAVPPQIPAPGPKTPCAVDVAQRKCKATVPFDAMSYLQMDYNSVINSCATDYINACDAERGGILEGYKNTALSQVQPKLADCIASCPKENQARISACQAFQRQYHLGSNPCPGINGTPCNGNGICYAYGCSCNPGFAGITCERVGQ